MKKLTIFLLLAGSSFLNSCSFVQQAQQIANLINCDFRLNSVQNLTLAGVNVQNIQSLSSLNVVDVSKLSTAALRGGLPLDFTLNLDIRNPNKNSAGMTQLDWILLIDGIEITHGLLNQKVNIPGNNTTTMVPMHMNVDLKKVLSNKSGDAIINFAMNLAGAGNKPTRFTLKAKPTILIGNYPLTYPNYLDINTNFSGITK